MQIIEQIKITTLQEAIRLNTYCEKYVSFFQSRKSVKKGIKNGAVLLNGQKVPGGTWLKIGDEIMILDLIQSPPKTYHLDIPVIYEDNHLAIVNKPAGLTVSGNQFKTLANTLRYNLIPTVEKHALSWPLPTHRIDNQTSGLVIIAKTKPARIKIGQLFEEKKIEKTYHALAMGRLETKEGWFDSAIENKNAATAFQVISEVKSLKNEYLTLVKLKPITGRTHQIRIHLSRNNTPILGDKLYSEETIQQKGLFLCANKVIFNHPITNELLNIEVPLPLKFNTRMKNEQRRWQNYHA
ncbi:RluA family pseudouridine synthase [Putridiphycobacter roseus]|uniref:RluA family pseudouridine synthase n=1 Tax=Putridiphycobacter roseus TaxID=2219161 RepID=A0A2W1NGP1_9FLAO|nr:RluA family pseudouridine synthase [Putridiphycobacter roseus]PZE18273.1 RluA family pseudouridine synthase [Putridiphycobacter roseus]